MYITYVNQMLYYGTAINEKYTNVNVFTIAKQELTRNNQTSSEEKICDISQVVAKKIIHFPVRKKHCQQLINSKLPQKLSKSVTANELHQHIILLESSQQLL